MIASVGWAETVTFTAGTDKGESLVVKDDITVSMSTMNRDDNYRCNANTNMTVYGKAGITITKIEITCTGSGTNTNGPGKFSLKEGSPGEYSYSGSLGTWVGSSTINNKIYLTAAAQVRMTQIVVTYEVATPAYTITAQSNNTSYGTVSLNGSVISGSPNNGYRYADPAYTVDPANSATVVQDDNEFTVTPSANTTVTINFEAIPTFTVTLGDDNSTLTETIGGAGVTLPSRSTLNGYEFAGWSTTNVATETTTAPTIIEAGAYAPTADITLYPVYTKTVGAGGTTNKTASVTISDYAGANQWGNGTQYKTVTLDDNITATASGKSNTGKYYTTGNSWRIYSSESGKLILNASNGAEFTSATISFSNSTLSFGGNAITSGSPVSLSGTSAEFAAGGTTYITAISVSYAISGAGTTYYWSAPVAAAVEIPSIVVAENPFMFSTTATITCATEDATIEYSFDGENWSKYSSALTITETKTIYAKAIKGENESDVTQVTATKNLATPSVTISGDLTLDLDGKTDVNAGTLTAAVTYNDAAIDGATVTWSSNKPEVATIDASTGAVIIKTTGSVTFTATYAGNSDYAEVTATKTVTVIDNNAPGSAGNPYTVAQARAAIDASTGTQGVYATGIVSKIVTAYNSQYGNISYNISDDGKTTSDQLQAYRGKSYNGDNFTNADDIQVGDKVVVHGNLQKHTSIYEFDANNQLVSLERNESADAGLSFGENTSFEINFGDAFTAPTLENPHGLTILYTSDNENVATVDATSGEVTIVGKGTVKITASSEETDDYKAGIASYTIKVKDPNVSDAMFNFNDNYSTLFPTLKGVSSTDSTDGDITEALTTKVNDVKLTISAKEENNSTANRIWTTAPRLRMYSGSLTISAPSASKIKAITFTGHNTNFDITPSVGTLNEKVWEGEAETVVFTVNKNTQIGTIEVAYETTPVVEPGTPAAITAGFYRIKNLGNNLYVNVAGRKTVTFVDADATATAAGTVLKVESNDKGQVQVLRSQAIDLPGYADKAMKYVPEVVQLVVNKLHAEGSGAILGENGLDKIMEKFDASFDYHLYTEQAEGGIRIYGKTPSMRPVVEFYNENKDNVDAKLPMLEDFINDAINKILDKTGGRGSSILVPFSLLTVWENMGGTASGLTKPENDATKLTFLQEVLSNEQNVWDFAYHTAMIYWGKVKEHPRYDEFKGKLGDYAKYIDKIEYIRPNVKYYLVANGSKLDVFSQDNEMVKNGNVALWDLEERDDFQVTFNEENVLNGKYYTTLYTDFAYTLPEGVKAYKVTKVSDAGVAVKVALESVPAQTPVLLESESAGAKTLTLNTDEGTALTDNILVGADAIINEYDINESQVVSLFEFALEVLGESTYNEYLAKYEHLMDRNSGTVNNKFFFGLTTKELGKGADEEGLISARSLAMQDNLLGFYENWDVSANHAFLLNKDYDPVKLFLKGDIDRDGDVDNDDLKALIKIILGTDTEEDNYDYDAAHVNDDEDIDIADVTALVNYLKNLQTQTNN